MPKYPMLPGIWLFETTYQFCWQQRRKQFVHVLAVHTGRERTWLNLEVNMLVAYKFSCQEVAQKENNFPREIVLFSSLWPSFEVQSQDSFLLSWAVEDFFDCNVVDFLFISSSIWRLVSFGERIRKIHTSTWACLVD